jgi:hypothetical protein
VLALALGGMPARGLAATIVSGRVTDRTSDNGIVGVEVRVERAGANVGSARTQADGSFLLTFEGAAGAGTQSYTLHAAHADFAAVSRVFSVVAGRPDQAFYKLELLPRALTRCVQSRSPAVLVGAFTGPQGSDAKDLAWKLSQALTYSLLTQLQRHGIRPDLEPSFPACAEAELRDPDLASGCARALGADALVFGRVKQVSTRFEVTTFIGDSYDFYAPPAAFPNRRVDLEAPESAVFDPSTHAAILAVVAAGFERRSRFAECVEVTVAAEQLAGRMTPGLKALRDRCKQGTGTAALLRGGGP